jgi:hypothetical protein
MAIEWSFLGDTQSRWITSESCLEEGYSKTAQAIYLYEQAGIPSHQARIRTSSVSLMHSQVPTLESKLMAETYHIERYGEESQSQV